MGLPLRRGAVRVVAVGRAVRGGPGPSVRRGVAGRRRGGGRARALAEPPRLGPADRPGPGAVDQPGRRRGGGEPSPSGRSVEVERRGPTGRRSAGRAGPATPATTSRARAWSKAGMPGRPGASQATARCGRSPRIEPTSGDRTEPGPDLDEDPGPVVVHRLDHRGEPDRAGEVLAEPAGDRRGVGRVGRGVEVRVDRAVGAAPIQADAQRSPAGRAPRRPRASGTRRRPAGPGPGARPPSPARPPRATPPRRARRSTVCLGPFPLTGDDPVEPLDQAGRPRPARPARAAIAPGSSPSGLEHQPAPRRRRARPGPRPRAQPAAWSATSSP